MNEITMSNRQLPDTLEDLKNFVLVGEEQLSAYRAKLKAIKKVGMAQEVYNQTLLESQEMAQAVIEAAQRVGELLLQIEKAQGKRTDITSSTGNEEVKTKTEITTEMGMTKDQVSQYQQMAQNPDVVKVAIQKAIDNGDVVSRSQVMKEIRAVKEEARREIERLQNRKPEIKEVVKEVIPPDYEDLRHKAEMSDIHEKDFKRMQGLYDEMAEKWKKANIEKEQIKDAWEKEKNSPTEELRKSALSFCAGISNFIERYGGYVWLTEKLNELPERERDGFVAGINALEAWVQQMKFNMEGLKDE